MLGSVTIHELEMKAIDISLLVCIAFVLFSHVRLISQTRANYE